MGRHELSDKMISADPVPIGGDSASIYATGDYPFETDMLKELLDDNRQLTQFLRSTHELCDRHRDVATASLLENWIDEAERRV